MSQGGIEGKPSLTKYRANKHFTVWDRNYRGGFLRQGKVMK